MPRIVVFLSQRRLCLFEENRLSRSFPAGIFGSPSGPSPCPHRQGSLSPLPARRPLSACGTPQMGLSRSGYGIQEGPGKRRVDIGRCSSGQDPCPFRAGGDFPEGAKHPTGFKRPGDFPGLFRHGSRRTQKRAAALSVRFDFLSPGIPPETRPPLTIPPPGGVSASLFEGGATGCRHPLRPGAGT